MYKKRKKKRILVKETSKYITWTTLYKRSEWLGDQNGKERLFIIYLCTPFDFDTTDRFIVSKNKITIKIINK